MPRAFSTLDTLFHFKSVKCQRQLSLVGVWLRQSLTQEALCAGRRLLLYSTAVQRLC